MVLGWTAEVPDHSRQPVRGAGGGGAGGGLPPASGAGGPPAPPARPRQFQQHDPL